MTSAKILKKERNESKIYIHVLDQNLKNKLKIKQLRKLLNYLADDNYIYALAKLSKKITLTPYFVEIINDAIKSIDNGKQHLKSYDAKNTEARDLLKEIRNAVLFKINDCDTGINYDSNDVNGNRIKDEIDHEEENAELSKSSDYDNETYESGDNYNMQSEEESIATEEERYRNKEYITT